MARFVDSAPGQEPGSLSATWDIVLITG